MYAAFADACRVQRSTLYYKPIGETPGNLKLMRLIDEQFLKTPWYGSRQMARWLQREGHEGGRHRVCRLMRKMRLRPIYKASRTSDPHPAHKIYPYLLKDLNITRPNHVWCTDITYIPMQRGFLYLVAIRCTGPYTGPRGGCCAPRIELAVVHRCTAHIHGCGVLRRGVPPAALKEALERYGKPEIFNTDQGSQFTSGDFTGVLLDAKIKISMDGKGRWIDNRFPSRRLKTNACRATVERLWRSLKYECVYIHAFETGIEARRGIGAWIDYYNTERPHSALNGRTPGEAYEGLPMQIKQAA